MEFYGIKIQWYMSELSRDNCIRHPSYAIISSRVEFLSGIHSVEQIAWVLVVSPLCVLICAEPFLLIQTGWLHASMITSWWERKNICARRKSSSQVVIANTEI